MYMKYTYTDLCICMECIYLALPVFLPFCYPQKTTDSPETDLVKHDLLLYILNSHVNLYPHLESMSDFEGMYKKINRYSSVAKGESVKRIYVPLHRQHLLPGAPETRQAPSIAAWEQSDACEFKKGRGRSAGCSYLHLVPWPEAKVALSLLGQITLTESTSKRIYR